MLDVSGYIGEHRRDHDQSRPARALGNVKADDALSIAEYGASACLVQNKANGARSRKNEHRAFWALPKNNLADRIGTPRISVILLIPAVFSRP